MILSLDSLMLNLAVLLCVWSSSLCLQVAAAAPHERSADDRYTGEGPFIGVWVKVALG